jgi:hypothetical protein
MFVVHFKKAFIRNQYPGNQTHQWTNGRLWKRNTAEVVKETGRKIHHLEKVMPATAPALLM